MAHPPRMRWIERQLAPSSRLRRLALLLALLLPFGPGACARDGKTPVKAEKEPLARTEFTPRVENYFEYDPLKAGRPSRFLIHLTDLSDGSPVERAEVRLIVRARGGGAEVAQTKARVGKVTGIYVAHVTFPRPGDYQVELHIQNAKFDERMRLTGFPVE